MLFSFTRTVKAPQVSRGVMPRVSCLVLPGVYTLRQVMLTYAVNGPVATVELNALFTAGGLGAGWPPWQRSADTSDWRPVLARSLAYVTARRGEVLVGFVNVAWDGRDHAFVLDTRVHPDERHRGVGVALVRTAARAATAAGCAVLHVDYDASLAPFYTACGFQPTSAGLLQLPP
jgi:GNAT superfamily N-acetyltransferase